MRTSRRVFIWFHSAADPMLSFREALARKKLFSSEIVTFIIHGDIFNIENFPTWKKLLLLACPPLVMLSHPFNELPDLLLLCSASASFIPFDGSMGRAGEWKVKWKEKKCFKIEKKNGMKETRRRKINRKWDENKQEKLIRSSAETENSKNSNGKSCRTSSTYK